MNDKKIKILFFIPTLSPGGAQRIISFLAKDLDKQFFDTKLIVIGFKENASFDISGINYEFLSKGRILIATPAIVKIIRKEKPHIVMGSIAHLNTQLGLISILFPKTVFVGRQTNISKTMNEISSSRKKTALDWFYRCALNKLNYIVCQSQDMAIDCINELNLSKDKIVIIRNPITDKFLVKSASVDSEIDRLKLITVGRLEKIKGHGRLINILSKFDKPFNYLIIGNGPLKENLMQLIKENNLQQQIRLIDFTTDVQEYLSNSDLFLQGSFAEGFPNAVLESCAVGTPVLAFNCPGGTSEIIRNDYNGYLVDSESEFLKRLYQFKPLNRIEVSQSVYQKFSKDIILKEYEGFFKSVTSKAMI